MNGDPKNLLLDQFQELVSETLIRHKSVLDVMSKFQEANARANRAVAKAVTSCGCVQINASKQEIPGDASLYDLHEHMDNHVSGVMCDHCRETLEAELGREMFYLAALCNAFGLNLHDVTLKEHQRVSALGVFHAS